MGNDQLEVNPNISMTTTSEWAVAPSWESREFREGQADEIVVKFLDGSTDVGEKTGIKGAVEFAAKGKRLNDLTSEDVREDVNLEMRLTDEDRRLSEKDIRFLQELDEFLEKLEDEKWKGIVETTILASEKLMRASGVDENSINNNGIHTLEVIKNAKMLGGGRLVQLMAAGHDGIKSPSDLAGHEAKSAVFNGSVGDWFETKLGELGFSGEVMTGALGRYLEKSYTHRENEFPETKAREGGTRTIEVGGVAVEVGLLWGSKMVRLPDEMYQISQDGVNQGGVDWVNDQVELMQTADIATGLSRKSLDKYHLLYTRKGKFLSDIIASDEAYYGAVFGSFLSNIIGALDEKAMQKYISGNEFRQSLVIRRLMRLSGDWRNDTALSGLSSTEGVVVGNLFDSLREYREKERGRLAYIENDTDEEWRKFGLGQKEKFHELSEAVGQLSEEELIEVAAVEMEQLEADMVENLPKRLKQRAVG